MTRLLALDIGDERIGVALSDELCMLARPLLVLDRVAGSASFRSIAEIVSQQAVSTIVVGLPLLEDGTRGKQVASTEAYIRGLQAYVVVPIVYWDERNTTFQAREMLSAGRTRRGPSSTGIDAAAAAVILQDYIDHYREDAR